MNPYGPPSGYPGGQPGYPGGQPCYPGGQPGYPGGQPGYGAPPAYPGGQPNYGGPPAYPGGPAGYPGMPQPGCGGQPTPYGASCYGAPFSLVHVSSSSFPPPQTIQKGNQTDGYGVLWSAVANTPHGTIPGKAKDGTCWYPYGGKEHLTKDFSWITCGRPVEMIWNGGPVPPQAIQCGVQTDGCGNLYAAVAETKWGRIPGKAKDGTCWYSYGGKEHHTKDFHWLATC